MDDVIVIGGGIVGASTAYHLARGGAQVTLIDRDWPGQATAAGAGIISPGTSLKPQAAFFPLAFRAVAYYEELLAHLAEDGEATTGYETVGLLHIATTPEEANRLPILLHLFQERQATGVKNLGEIHLIDDQTARQLFPPLGITYGAIYTSGAARIDGRLMRDALRGAAQFRGAKIVMASQGAELIREGQRIGKVRVDGQTLTTDAVVIATGAWSGEYMETLGLTVPVYPQRGQILHLEYPEETGHWPIIQGFHSHYLLTFPGGRVVAGATRENDAGFEVRATVGGIHEDLYEALRVAPGLARANIHEIRVGLRPATPDGLPILGHIPGVENAFLATGHGPSGLQLGPYSGALIAELALGHQSAPDLAPFAVTRFQKEKIINSIYSTST